jgi:hypothetical protein
MHHRYVSCIVVSKPKKYRFEHTDGDHVGAHGGGRGLAHQSPQPQPLPDKNTSFWQPVGHVEGGLWAIAGTGHSEALCCVFGIGGLGAWRTCFVTLHLVAFSLRVGSVHVASHLACNPLPVSSPCRCSLWLSLYSLCRPGAPFKGPAWAS